MTEYEHIALDNFDREYGLSDLFPVTQADELLGPMADVLQVSVLLPGGEIHYGTLKRGAEPIKEAMRSVDMSSDGFFLLTAPPNDTAVFALTHELETIGYLIIEGEDGSKDHHLVSLGRFIANAVTRMIYLNYKNRLTAGIHGRVVVDSYAELRNKAEKLQISEKKYRLLAQNLEIEVARKTEKIKTAQLAVLQQEKLASIGQLAAGMAHEINNPIGFIISNLNTLLTYAEDSGAILKQCLDLNALIHQISPHEGMPSQIPDKVAQIERLSTQLDVGYLLEDTSALITESLEGAARIKTIVQNLREFARPSIETHEVADINLCIDTTLQLLSSQVGSGVRFVKDYHSIPTVTCSLREINQVFFHILRNALQATGGNGEVRISTRADDKNMVEIMIRDNGPGINEKVLPHIFEPFFTTRDVGEGTGMGLNLAYNIINKHGGTIEAKSQEGEGACFSVRLPRNIPANGDSATVN